MSIIQNISEIKDSLPSNVTLVVISKRQPNDKIMEAYSVGERIFGENRPQELLKKYESLPKDIKWHMIGPLQTNKVKYIVPFIDLIHSVDSERLIDAINREAKKVDRITDILLEVFVATEETKHGWSSDELIAFFDKGRYSEYPNVRFRGVMGMASYTEDESQVRAEFHELKSVFEKLKSNSFFDVDYFDTLSMGMSGDFRIAIEEGSTMVRIGSSIFNR